MSYDHERRDRTATTVGTPPKPYSAVYPPLDPESWDLMGSYLDNRGLSFTLAIKNGWYPATLRWESICRVVIPAFSYQEGNRYWQARDITHCSIIRYQSPHGVNRGDAFVRVVPTTENVRGLVIAEGPMDALAAAECGYVGVGLMGAQPPLAVLAAIARYQAGLGRPTDADPSGGVRTIVVSDEGAMDAATKVWRNFPGAELRGTYPWKDLASVPYDDRLGILNG